MATREPVAHDEAPSAITDHPFVPKGQWWSLCVHCGLAQAAHTSSTINTAEEIRKDHARQKSWREAERARLQKGGRVRIGYQEDDFDDD
jgi:hypothetical protein